LPATPTAGRRSSTTGGRMKFLSTKLSELRSKNGSRAAVHLVRWTASLAGLRALSARQPWAWLIVNGFKDIENRSRRTHHREPLLIHAGLSFDGYAEKIEWVERKHGISVPLKVDTGGIVGVVDVMIAS